MNPTTLSDPTSFLLACAVLVLLVALLYTNGRRYYYRAKYRSIYKPDLSDTQVQLGIVKVTHYQTKSALNKETRVVYYNLKDALQERFQRKYLLFAEVSLGAFLQCTDKIGHKCVNSKRIDFLVTTTKGYPVLAIEYQGSGHYQKDAKIRDEIKRIAFTSADLKFYEIHVNSPAEVYQKAVVDIITAVDFKKTE